MHEEDRQLVKRLLAGEEAAFNAFFTGYFGRLFRFALRRVGNDQAVADDVVQETLCRALRNLESYRGEASLFTWLCQICRSKLSEHYVRERRSASRVVAAEDEPAVRAALESLEAPADANPETAAGQADVAELVQVVIDRLPLKYANVLEWKYVEGLAVESIAERLGVRHPAAQSLLQRAREAFKDGFRELAGAALGGEALKELTGLE